MSYRIRSVAQRSGISAVTLRAWERRYGFPHPLRTDSGYRAYSDADVAQIIAVKDLIATGSAASEAIALVRAGKMPPASSETAAERVEAFLQAAEAVDELRLEAIATEALSTYNPKTFCTDFAIPALRASALRLDVACEHLATGIIRADLRRSLERIPPKARTSRPYLLACPPGEAHEGGLLAIAVELRLLGVRTVVLGANTPVEGIASAAKRSDAQIVALSMIVPRSEAEVKKTLTEVVSACAGVTVIVGGFGARRHLRAVFEAGAQFAETSDEVLAISKK